MDDRSVLLEFAVSQSKGVQEIACFAACERAYPLIDRLGSYKSRLVSRYAVEELWGRVFFGWSHGNFSQLVERLPEVSAWNCGRADYYAMSGISVIAHAFRFIDSSSRENLVYVIGALLDLAVEYDAAFAPAAPPNSSVSEMEIASQRRVCTVASGWPNLDSQAKELIRVESFSAGLAYQRPIDLFCSQRGWHSSAR